MGEYIKKRNIMGFISLDIPSKYKYFWVCLYLANKTNCPNIRPTKQNDELTTICHFLSIGTMVVFFGFFLKEKSN